jgi:hypothetical protein
VPADKSLLRGNLDGLGSAQPAALGIASHCAGNTSALASTDHTIGRQPALWCLLPWTARRLENKAQVPAEPLTRERLGGTLEVGPTREYA